MGDVHLRLTMRTQQQELFIVVVAGLAAREIRRPGLQEVMVDADDADNRKELLLLSPSILVPCLTHDGVEVWDTLAIAEYLNEVKPRSGLLPADRKARAHCRAVCGEMHSGFASLRSALPMNLKRSFPGHKVWARARGDIERITTIWRDCLDAYGGPFLFGKRSMADAMYAPVVTRFVTYDVALDRECATYCERIRPCPICSRGSPPRKRSPKRSTSWTWNSEEISRVSRKISLLKKTGMEDEAKGCMLAD
jgi:glutathione S-transferase